MNPRAVQLCSALARAPRLWALAAAASAFALLLTACGGDDVQAPETAAALPVTVSGADQASVSFRELDAQQARQVTVRVARDATGAPPLDIAYAPLGEVYQFTPLGWVEAAIEIRIPFAQAALSSATPRLLIAMPGGDWSEVPEAHREGHFMVARVPHLAYATVAARNGDDVPSRLKALATGSASAASTARALSLSFDAQTTVPALPAPNADGVVTLTAATGLALNLQYSLPSGCTVAPKVGAYAAVWRPATQKLSTVQLGQQAVSSTAGSVSYRLPISASDNGTWVFASTAVCKEPGKFLPRYAVIAAGPVLVVNVGSDPAAPPPAITTAPQDLSVIEGDAVNFSVVAQGSDLAYEWQRSNDGGASYTPIAGGTTASLNLVATLADNAALFRVRVSNVNGSVTSTPARLSVAQKVMAPVVTSDPSNQSVLEGETASFSVAGSGSPAPTVQWQQRAAANADANAGWADIAGATGATHTTAATALAQSGSQYRAVLRNSGGTATTLAATLTVQARVIAPALTSTPANQAVQVGQFGLFSVAASGTSPLSYQWFKNGQPITGANATEVLVAAEAADVGNSVQISVQVSNSAGSVTSAPASMTVTNPPAAGTLIKASDGGLVQGGTGLESDPVLQIPAGALAQDTRITLFTESSAVAGLPADFVPLGDVINVGPAGLTFSQPATLSLPVPEVALDGKVLALVVLDGPIRVQSLSAQRSVATALNLRRVAIAKQPAGGVRILAAGDVLNVLCGRAANGVAGRFSTLLTAGARLLQVAVPASACTAFAPAPPLGGVPSDTEVACSSEEEFAGVTGGTDFAEISLVSRHVDCRTSVSSSSVELSAALTEGPQGTFKYANPALASNGNWSSFTLGTVQSIETRVVAFGPASQLNKSYRVRVRALGYVANPGYPGPQEGRNTMVVRPQVDCLAFDQLASTCSYTAPEIEVPLNGEWSDAKDFIVTLNWTQDPNRPVDAETFLVGVGTFDYKIKGTSFERPPERTESFRFVASYGYAPKLRCDRKVAQANSDGCVFSEAAAVYVLSKAPGSDVQEAAEHIFAAQNDPDPAKRSPGKWLLKPGTRAVADESVRANNALQRAKLNKVQQGNNYAACERTVSTSLIRQRPSQSSATCSPFQAGCDCDEYPFAATWNGAKVQPDTTSVKWINSSQNRRAGGGLPNFYLRQRVLDFTQVADGPFSPFDLDFPSSSGGDDFWVHIK